MRWKVMLVPAAFVLCYACSPTEPETDDYTEVDVVTAVTVTPARAELFVEEQLQLQATPENVYGYWVPKANCVWSTADSTVVGVGSAGLAGAVSPGSAVVTATCDGVAGSAFLTVDSLIMAASVSSSGVFFSVGGSSDTDVFAAGTTEMWGCCGTILHYDGSSWIEMATPPVPGALRGVWVSSATDAFAVGPEGAILHFDGTAWASMQSGTTTDLVAVWGSSPQDVFAAGPADAVLHYDGQSWSPVSIPSGSAPLAGIWGSSGTDVFAVGPNGTILHYDGMSWAAMSSGTDASLNAVWGFAANDVFAVGDHGTVLHYDGISWSRSAVSTTHNLTGIWGTADNHVFVVGTDDWFYFVGTAVVLRYDGVDWRASERTLPHALLGVWGTAEDLFLVGDDTVLRVRPWR